MPPRSPDNYTFTVGKLDAGMAILLGERAHLIEFPSLLLPPGATAGSIVNISVTQNVDAERKRDDAFWKLQDDILTTFGQALPKPPQISLRNVTQTSVALEWPPLELATASLRSLDIYRNGSRLATIPSPLTNTTTKLSGLDIATEYNFRLVLRTSAGTFPSNLVRVRTHTMQDTSGISVCFGNVQDPVLLEHAKLALGEMRAKWTEKIHIDTTHFVCTTPAAVSSSLNAPPGSAASNQANGQLASAPGVEYQRALQLSIPIVQPQWILACHTEKKMVQIAPYYLGATPASPMNAPPFSRPQSMSQTSLPQSARAVNRSSVPPPSAPASSSSHARAQSTPSGPTSASDAAVRDAHGHGGMGSPPLNIEPTVDEQEEEDVASAELNQTRSPGGKTMPHARHGTMDRAFKFPPPKSPTDPGDDDGQPASSSPVETKRNPTEGEGEQGAPFTSVTPRPLSVEVPPPPSPQKEKERVFSPDDEVGETVEISLN